MLHIDVVAKIYAKERKTNPSGHACCLLLMDDGEKQRIDFVGRGMDIALLIAGFFDDDKAFQSTIEASMEVRKMTHHEKA